MPINLEVPKKFGGLVSQAHQVAENVFRTNSRKYDLAEHEYPKELDMLAAVIDGMNDSGALGGAGAGTVGTNGSNGSSKTVRRRWLDPQRVEHGQPARRDRAVLGRCRVAVDDAPPGARPGGDRRRRRRGAAEALRRQVGRDGDHRARGRLGLGRDPSHGTPRRERPPASTSSTARRSSSPAAIAPS